MSNIIKIFVESRNEVYDAILLYDYNYQLLHKEGGLSPEIVSAKDCTPIRPLYEILKEAEETGGTVQWWGKNHKEWFNGLNKLDSIYRIKPTPKPKLRAYTFDEAVEVFTQNPWVRVKNANYIASVVKIHDTGVVVNNATDYDYEEVLRYFTHLNGNPCGIEEGGEG